MCVSPLGPQLGSFLAETQQASAPMRQLGCFSLNTAERLPAERGCSAARPWPRRPWQGSKGDGSSSGASHGQKRLVQNKMKLCWDTVKYLT